MNITPHLGIGDLLIIKMKEITNNLDIKNININSKLIEEYSGNYETKLHFTKKLINFLFPYCSVSVTNGPCDFQIFNHYSLNQIYIYNHINHNLINFDNKYNDYIIFHTKCRHDFLMDNFINEILPNLNLFLDNFTTPLYLTLKLKFALLSLKTKSVSE